MTKKKGEKKKTTHKKSSKVHHSTDHHTAHHEAHHTEHHPSDIHVEKVLVENFVSLQKVMTNLSLKFDSLSTQISKLLELFEISAKTMAQKDFELGGKNDKEMMDKIDNLLEQNKVIARGLTLLHEPEGPVSPPMQRPLPQAPMNMRNPQPAAINYPSMMQPKPQISQMQRPPNSPQMYRPQIQDSQFSQMQDSVQQENPPAPKPILKPTVMQRAVEENPSDINMADYQKSQHIDESQNMNFDLSRNEKKKDEFEN